MVLGGDFLKWIKSLTFLEICSIINCLISRRTAKTVCILSYALIRSIGLFRMDNSFFVLKHMRLALLLITCNHNDCTICS